VIRQALAAKLVSAVGSTVGNRIRPVVLAQSDARPAIVFRRATSGHDPPLEGGDDVPGPAFEVTSWADTYEDSVALAEAVRAALENEGRDTWAYSGGSVTVHSVTYLDEEDVFDERDDGSSKPIYGVAQTYEIIYED
jgi:hypothetical protein